MTSGRSDVIFEGTPQLRAVLDVLCSGSCCWCITVVVCGRARLRTDPVKNVGLTIIVIIIIIITFTMFIRLAPTNSHWFPKPVQQDPTAFQNRDHPRDSGRPPLPPRQDDTELRKQA